MDKDGVNKPPTLFTKKLLKEVDEITALMNKKDLYVFEKEFILYLSWRFFCRTNDNFMFSNVMDQEQKQYWEIRRETEPSPGYE